MNHVRSLYNQICTTDIALINTSNGKLNFSVLDGDVFVSIGGGFPEFIDH